MVNNTKNMSSDKNPYKIELEEDMHILNEDFK